MNRFDRSKYFDSVRASMFKGSMTQQQVDGQSFKLDVWENRYPIVDVRWLAYCFATSYHETAQKMWPIEEYGKGQGMKYGVPDPVTGKVYYGRGDVQLTWSDNYKRATEELRLTDDNDLYWHPEMALDPSISAAVMYRGMSEGWFTGKKLGDYFNSTKDDAYGARAIVNADVSKNGQKVADYYTNFRKALTDSLIASPIGGVVVVNILKPKGVEVEVNVIEGT